MFTIPFNTSSHKPVTIAAAHKSSATERHPDKQQLRCQFFRNTLMNHSFSDLDRFTVARVVVCLLATLTSMSSRVENGFLEGFSAV
jgi:hypothetical protein